MTRRLILIGFVVLLSLASLLMLLRGSATWTAIDFTDFYRAGQAVTAGTSPYTVARFYNPAWIAVLFAPLSLLPLLVAYLIYTAVFITAYTFIVLRLSRASWFVFALLLLSPFLIVEAVIGNIDWLVLLGAILPPPIGIWLVLSKPQMGLILALLWFVRYARARDARMLLLTFAPVSIGMLISLALGMHAPDLALISQWSFDVWPVGLLLGLPLIYLALRRNNDALALASAPLISPYVGSVSWMSVLPAISPHRKLTAAFIALTWIVLLLAWR